MDRSDLSRWWGRTLATLDMTPHPAGYRPPPGGATPRLLFAFVWLILGVIQTRIFLSARTALMGALALLWFLLAARDFVRARYLMQAERRAHDDDA